MDVLVAMGSFAAYLYGVVVVLGMVFGFSDVVGKDDYFESAAVILTLITLGKLLTRYNEIVASCETDPTLVVRIPNA